MSIQTSILKPIYFGSNEGTKACAGKVNPIELRLIDIDQINQTIGEKIAYGDCGTIYKVNDCNPPRVYKVIPQDRFANGDEIRISKIAGDKGIAPTFHDAFVVNQHEKKFVVIEMDDAGLSVGKWMEKLAEKTETDIKTVDVEKKVLSDKEKAIQEMLKKVDEKYNNYTFTEIVRNKRLSLEETLNKLYPKKEVFYFELFKKIKLLAENNIAYGDSHTGNIMPNLNTDKELQLIDFDAAALVSDPQTAKLKSISSAYNQVHFNQFRQLPELSDESKQLIQWFQEN